ncbi:hypothetical protein [Paraliomyxa miuraensis]|uniref:hypothetical protein n=1 Tax=Paraliomyxa miuraensis TaxID=376150 RepID=UPI0022505394|nr:hypothetical protein [Paraliomyxa miuraensis]MCX4243315.1 hypothetical protein [Paraliomyxa miuraensis]
MVASSGRRGIVALASAVVLALVIAVGLGWFVGEGGSDSGASASGSEPAVASPKPRSKARERVVVIDGKRCSVHPDPPSPCADVCASLRKLEPAPVDVDVTYDRYGFRVDMLACLREAGVTDVRLVHGGQFPRPKRPPGSKPFEVVESDGDR